MARLNGRIGKVAMAAALLAVPAMAERRLVVSIPDRKLELIVDGEVVKSYPVAVGKHSTPSPTGTFTIVTRVPNPTWYGPTQVVAPGRHNPLGTRWLGLSEKGYGVHGTNVPRSIGKAASHGCIRMRNSDVEELFELVRAGDVVELTATSFAEPEAPAIELTPAAVQVAAATPAHTDE